jgi:cytochrome oxidase Cu insertion factor (SCO1/SenC/PrrC family)
MADRVTGPRRGWSRIALAGILAVTTVWWALALWPLPATAPEWLSRTRAVCFGSTPSGLPDTQGWMLLFLQPALMLGQAIAIWGRDLAADLGAMTRSRPGRLALAGVAIALLAAAGAAAARVHSATGVAAQAAESSRDTPGWIRVGRVAPPLELVGAGGAPVRLADLRGRPVFVAFAFAHCQTACPRLVHEVLTAQRALPDPVVIVVTLDPWRDTPSRIESIEERWGMEDDAWVASGSVPQVESTLEAWGIDRSRNPRNGDLVHIPRVFLIDRAGNLAYEADADARLLADLGSRL